MLADAWLCGAVAAWSVEDVGGRLLETRTLCVGPGGTTAAQDSGEDAVHDRGANGTLTGDCLGAAL